ncbi:hypothetical protein H6P81_016126 [Aristolochia fimbriata]|uniref:Cation efflux protein cytoplasmic domain-containing protein n=1 Tax=Aristolochia fimbriata TaxID=158543 RepID=A0AAV7E8P4_ARIFI|nr:hypothetical protein H6P81_016126 [Aristolochia fimbriata]
MGFRFLVRSPLYGNSLSGITAASRNRNSFNCFLLPISHNRAIDSSVYPNGYYSKISWRSHMGHSHHHGGEEGEGVFRLGLAADIALSTGKAITGYLSGSTAIIADAAHSISDVVLSGVALWSFRAARAPKDKEHPYGHGKFETLGALGISCMLLGTAGGIAWHAVDVLQGLLTSTHDAIHHSLAQVNGHNHGHHGHHHAIDMEHPILALSMTSIAILVKEGLYHITRRAGEKSESGLMKANAWHHRADAVSSVVALIGVGGAIVGVRFLDPLAGLVVSGMILKAGIETGYQSVLELVDAAVPHPVLVPIKQTILQVEGVTGCHHLRGRRAGSSLYLDVHIEVDPFLSVSAAHEIGENMRYQIHHSHPEVSEVFVHIDPSHSQCFSTASDQPKNVKVIQQDDSCEPQNVEVDVSDILSSKFSENMTVERITHHLLQGKLFLQVEVSMPPDMLIRDAMEVAQAAEKEIVRAASNVSRASVQLRLGNAIP